MGDRGNIAVRQEDGSLIYLYTHWRGSEVPDILAEALSKRERWNDGPYLTRIIFDTMTDGDRSTTGFGISTDISDNEHPIPVVEPVTQTVRYDGGQVMSFEEFIRRRGR